MTAQLLLHPRMTVHQIHAWCQEHQMTVSLARPARLGIVLQAEPCAVHDIPAPASLEEPVHAEAP